MSVSTKNIPKIIYSLKENESFILKKEKRESSSEKPRRHISLKNAFYKIDFEEKSIFKTELPILNFITNNTDGRFSAKTALTNSAPEKLDYDLCMINKYDENLNNSLSDISDFDLEEDEKKNDSFNSCDNEDSCVEEIEIKTLTKTNKKFLDNNEKEQIDFEFEKEWNDIKDLLFNKK